ncbi:MAG: hypothetical protein SWX82_14120 [Cyanobacteriota bacterium]|nr:hypothetical protein [Cyanobacteriota bacterium]
MERKKTYDAKETYTWREQGEDNLDLNSYDKSTPKTNISSFGDESKRADRTMGGTSYVAVPKAVIGGILNRLRILENKHLKYVNNHGERLEKRLVENHSHKSEIYQDMQYLENLLVKLLEGAEIENFPSEEE